MIKLLEGVFMKPKSAFVEHIAGLAPGSYALEGSARPEFIGAMRQRADAVTLSLSYEGTAVEVFRSTDHRVSVDLYEFTPHVVAPGYVQVNGPAPTPRPGHHLSVWPSEIDEYPRLSLALWSEAAPVVRNS